MKIVRWYWILLVFGLTPGVLGVLNVTGQNAPHNSTIINKSVITETRDTIESRQKSEQESSSVRGSHAQRDSIEISRTTPRDTLKEEKEIKKIGPFRKAIQEIYTNPTFKTWQKKEIQDFETIKDLPVKDAHIRTEANKVRENPRPYPLPSYTGNENSLFFYYKYAPDHRSTRIPLRLSTKEVAIQFEAKPSVEIGNSLEAEGLKFPSFISENLSEALKNGELMRGFHNFVFVQYNSPNNKEDILTTSESLRKLRDIQKVSEVFYGPEDIQGKAPLIPKDQIYVVFKDSTTPAHIQELGRLYGTEIIQGQKGKYKLRVIDGGGLKTLQVAEKYRQTTYTLIARPEFYTHSAKLLQSQSDPLYGSQWNLNDSQFKKDIDAPEAWKISKGDPSVTIAMLDTGVDLDHEDLIGNTQGGQHVDVFFAEYNRSASSQGRYISTAYWLTEPQGLWGFHKRRNNHGTAMSGIASAVSGNGLGLSGLVPNIKVNSLLTIAILDNAAQTVLTSHDIAAAAIDRARMDGAKVVNMSFQLDDEENDANFLQAVNNAIADNMVLVQAMGNDNIMRLPSPYHQSVIMVGATGQDGQRWNDGATGSNYDGTIDVVAPGVNVPTTDISALEWGYDPNGKYATSTGTSPATAQVSALAAMLFSVNSNFSPQDIRSLIRAGARDQVGNSSEDIGGFDQYHGYGLINAYNTLLLAKNSLVNGNFELPPVPIWYDIQGNTRTNGVSDWFCLAGDYTPVQGDGTGNGARAGFQSMKLDPQGGSLALALAYAGNYPGNETTLTATAWVKSQPGTTIWMQVMAADSTSEAGVYTPYEDLEDPNGNGWRPIEIVINKPGGNTSIILGSLGGIAYFDMVTVREGYAPLSKIVEGGFETGEDDLILGWQCDVGSPWEVNNTWPLHNSQHGPQIGLEDDQCMGTQIPETGTGTLTSYPFKVTKPYINFKLCGHNGNPTSGVDNRVEFQVKVGNDWLMYDVAYPPGTNDLVQYSWDVSNWQGVEARIRAVDGNSNGGYAWIGIDAVELSDTPATGEGGGGSSSIVNGNFDNGLTGWTATGPWKINGAWTIENGYPQPGQIGDFAGSFPPENATGTLTSDPFTIDKDYINFRIGGQDGANANKVRLIVGGNIVKEVGPPGDNGFVDVSWSVSTWNTQSAHIECVDGNSNGGYAWYCVDEFYLSDTPTTTVTKLAVLAQGASTFRSNLPDTFRVNQNIPNPFNPETTIFYELPREADVSLKIYNVLGQEIRSLVSNRMSAGQHAVVWNGQDKLGHIVSSGIYFYRFIAGPADETKKMLILK